MLPYKVMVDITAIFDVIDYEYHMSDEAREFLSELGEMDEMWQQSMYYQTKAVFHFRREEDAALFRLRFG